MPTGQKISSLTGQVEYDVAGNQKISAVNAQVEYDVPGNQKLSCLSAQVEYQGTKWQQNVSLTNRHLADYSDLLKDHTFNAHNLTASASVPTIDSGDYKEGINSAVYAKASSQYHYITDANLKSGFPLKNGDTTKQGTWCFWVKFNTLTGYQTLIAKENYQTAAKRTLQLDMVTSTLTAYWFYNTTNGYNTISIASGFVTGRWYHIAISFDGVNKYLNYRVWDDTAGSVVSVGSFDSSSFGGALNISDGVLSLGAAYDTGARTNYLDGKLNAVHVFNRFLGWKEIDAIRSGTWTKQEDYMGLDVAQVQAQIEYDTFQAQRVYGVSAQVEVDDVVSYTSQLLSQVEYEEPPNLCTSQLIVQVEYREAISFSTNINAGISTTAPRIFIQRDFTAVVNPNLQTCITGAHRYWRLYISAVASPSGATSASTLEYELRSSVGGSDLTGSGTASASSIFDASWTADKAVDNNTGTGWSSTNTAPPHWWKYDFGANNYYNIIEIKIVARPTYYYTTGTIISLQYSDDNVNFTTQKTIYGLAWSANEIKILDFSSPPKLNISSRLDETFTGNNGDYPDPVKWDRLYAGSLNEIQGNKLVQECTSVLGAAVTESNFYFTGDFDIQIDFNGLTCPGTSSWDFAFIAQIDATHYFYCDAWSTGTSTKRFYVGYRNGGSATYPYYISRTNNYGKLRLVRFGTYFIAFFSDGTGDWKALTSQIASPEIQVGSAGSAFKIRLQTNAWDSVPTAKTEWDNLVINSGEALLERNFLASVNSAISTLDTVNLDVAASAGTTYTSQLFTQVEYEVPAKNYTSQLFSQVEYEIPAKSYTSQLFLQVEYSKGCNFLADINSQIATANANLSGGQRYFDASIATAFGTSAASHVFITRLLAAVINTLHALQESSLKITSANCSIVWGQQTGVVEAIEDFSSNWTGTGDIVNTGDGEEIELEDGEYMESAIVPTGVRRIEIIKDGY